MPDAAPAARGVYKPRRPQASPLSRLVSDHLHRLQTVYDDRFAREYGPWRPVVAQVADKFLACGVLEHGFARIRCDDCAHEHLLAFSCKCRYCCPSCHAKRLALWTQWLDMTLINLSGSLAPRVDQPSLMSARPKILPLTRALSPVRIAGTWTILPHGHPSLPGTISLWLVRPVTSSVRERQRGCASLEPMPRLWTAA